MTRSEEAQQVERTALQQLERAVSEMLSHVEDLRTRAGESERRSEEVEELLRRFTGDRAEAGRMLSRLAALETENAELRERMTRGQEGVRRLLARIQFLEDRP